MRIQKEIGLAFTVAAGELVTTGTSILFMGQARQQLGGEMRTTEIFVAVVREQFRRLAGELPQDTASITETTEEGLLRLRLDPRSAFSSALEILIEDGEGCTVFIGAHGRFEHLA